MNGDSSIQFELAPISSPFGTLGKVGCLVSYAPTCFNPRVFQRSEGATAIGCLPIRWKELKTLSASYCSFSYLASLSSGLNIVKFISRLLTKSTSTSRV